MLALGLGLQLGQLDSIWTPARLFSGAAGFWAGQALPSSAL